MPLLTSINNAFGTEYGSLVDRLPRACLKIHSWHLHAPLRGIFGPNSLNVAHYIAFIWVKSPTSGDVQLPEIKFQTRFSSVQLKPRVSTMKWDLKEGGVKSLVKR